MGLQLSDWYSGLPTFRLCGGWWARRRAMGGMEGASAGCGGLEEAGDVPADVPGWDSEEEDGSEEEALTASRPRRRAAGENGAGRGAR